MLVRGADGRPLGVVDAASADGLHVAGAFYPRAAISHLDNEIVYLADSAARVTESTGSVAGARDTRIVVPLAEERLRVATREIGLGEVEIRRRVVTEKRLVPVIARREELTIQRREPGQPWQPGEEPAPGDEVTSIPLRGWEPVVAPEAIITRELVIERARMAEAGQVTATVRREEVAVAEVRPTTDRRATSAPSARHRAGEETGWTELREQIRALDRVDQATDRRDVAPIERTILPLAEERVAVGGYATDLGEVRLVRRVIEEVRTVPVTVRRTIVEVARRGPDGVEFVYPLGQAQDSSGVVSETTARSSTKNAY
jgi:uncharacterized protein (TIGR02271 family)